MHLREWLSEHNGDDPAKIAAVVIDEHREWAIEMIADRIEHVRRDGVRDAERRAVASVIRYGDGEIRLPPQRSALDLFRLLLHQPIRLGDGRAVTWGDATIGDHEARITLLRKQRDGIDSTIQLHEQAIGTLRAAGASCLSAIPDAEAA